MLNLSAFIVFEILFLYLLYKLFFLIRKKYSGYLAILIIVILNLIIGIGSDVFAYFYPYYKLLDKIDYIALINVIIALVCLFTFIFFKYNPRRLIVLLIGMLAGLFFVILLVWPLEGFDYNLWTNYFVLSSSVVLMFFSVAIYYRHRQRGALYFLIYLGIMIARGVTTGYSDILTLGLSALGYVILTVAILKIGSNGRAREDIEYVLGKAPKRALKIQPKISIVFILLITLTILVLGIFSYYIIYNNAINVSLRQLESVAQIQENRINDLVDRDIERLKGVSSRTKLRLSLSSYNKEANEEDREMMRAILIDAKESIDDFEEIFIINSEGKVIASTDSVLEDKDYADNKLFNIGMIENHLHFNRLGDNIELYVHGPLILEEETIGVVVIKLKTEGIEAITKDYTGLGGTGETVLARRDDQGGAEFIHQRRFEQNSKNLIVTEDRLDIPMTQALLRNEFFYTEVVDYREEPVIAVTRYIEAMDWGLVVKIDREEILIPIYNFRNNLLVICGLLFLLAILVAYLISRSILKPIDNLRAGVENIEGGDLDYKVGTDSLDEIGDLSRAFDKMTEAIKKSRKDVDDKVKTQTKEIEKKQKDLELQQTAILNILEDVEEEKELANKEKEKIAAILYSIGDGVFVLNKNLEIILFNKAASKISGYRDIEVIGKRYDQFLKFIFEDTRKKNDKFIKRVFSEGEITSISKSTLLINKDNIEVPIADSAAPLKNKQGEVEGCVVVFRDATIERAIDRMKTEFVSVASHQLRTPLTAVNWNLEILGSEDLGKLNEKQRELVEEIYNSSSRMVNLVNDLLNVSRIETGRLRVVPTLVQLEDFIKDVIKEVQPLAKEKQCDITLSLPKNKVKKIPLDPTLMRQVLHNLMTNAIKYSKINGKVQVSLKIEDKNNILISIKDNGIGIPKAAQKMIFDKFFRADNAIKSATDGTGLGLYISKLIIESSHGKIYFKSKERKGSVFFISLPIKGMVKKEGEKGLA